MVTMGQQANVDAEPVVMTKQKETPEPEPAVGEALETGTESEQVLTALREELVT